MSKKSKKKKKRKQAYEFVDHPSHYNRGGIEAIDVIESLGWGEGFNRGSALKYLMRAGTKPGEDEVRELEKVVWYATRERDRVLKARAAKPGKKKRRKKR